ncbi:hypothetical protein KKG77_02565, partial [bacterium]|nr:hypothetical protein [bacterium]
MLRHLLVLTLLIFSLHAADSDEILNRADAFMQTNNKSNQFRAYDDYKSIYLRSIMENDAQLKIKALTGIVKSGSKLHIDVSAYSDELSQYNTSKKPLPTPPVEKKIEETPFVAPQKEAHDERKTEILYTSSKKSDDIKITSSHKLKSIRWQEGRMLLSFDNSLNQNQINYFTL